MRSKSSFKIALVNLDLEYPIDMWPSRKQSIGLAYISAVLMRAGFDVDLYDCRVNCTADSVKKNLLSREYNLIGFSFTGLELSKSYLRASNLKAAFRNVVTLLAKAVKKKWPKTKIIFGGYSATFWAKEILSTLDFVDYVCLGEGEMVMLDLANLLWKGKSEFDLSGLAYLKYGRLFWKPRPKLVALDSLPLPDRVGINPKEWIMINSSRGCYGRCTFCSTFAFYGEPEHPWWRARSADSVLKEIKALIKHNQAKKFQFAEDNFIGLDPNRIKFMIEGLLEMNTSLRFRFDCRVNDVLANKDLFHLLKRLGPPRIYLGCESGHQKTLDFFRKGTTVQQNIQAVNFLTELGIDVNPGLIMFHPFTTMVGIVPRHCIHSSPLTPQLPHPKE